MEPMTLRDLEAAVAAAIEQHGPDKVVHVLEYGEWVPASSLAPEVVRVVAASDGALRR